MSAVFFQFTLLIYEGDQLCPNSVPDYADTIGVRAPLDLEGGMGGGDLIARKKLHTAGKHVLHKRTQIAVKTKTFTIVTSNGRIIIQKLQLRTFARNFSNIDFFLKLLPLKDDELAMSEM